MPKSIVILTDEYMGDMEVSRYYIMRLAEAWRAMGMDVHVSGDGRYVPADIAILHIDISVIAEKHLQLAARYPLAINGRVRSILKSSFSDHLLSRDSDYRGRVIVKTDANYGGINEMLIGLEQRTTMSLAMEFERPWRKREAIRPKDYPVFERLADVPSGVWKNPKLVVEKFLAERRENGDYVTRSYLFFGEQELGMWFASPKPVIKSSTATSWGTFDEIPECLREARRKSGFGYGRFDYTVADGRVVLFDMNKTPALGEISLSLVSKEKELAFARAIDDFEPAGGAIPMPVLDQPRAVPKHLH